MPRGKLRLGRSAFSSIQNTLPLPTCAFHADDAAHQFDQPLAHHEADARAFLAVRLLPEPVERLEELRELLRRVNPAPVSVTPMRMRPGALAPQSTMTDPPALVVLDRVAQAG